MDPSNLRSQQQGYYAPPHQPSSTSYYGTVVDGHTLEEEPMSVKTERGGMITIISYCIMAVLILAEIITWKAQNSYPIEHVIVETS